MTTTPKVLLKRSSVIGKVPLPGDLEFGELAINFADGKIYYKDTGNTIKAFVDSARVEAIAAAVQVIAEAQLDSGEVTNLVNSSYVQDRQSYNATLLGGNDSTYYLDYTNFSNTPDISAIARSVSLDSGEAINLIDSAYVQLRQDYAYASLTGAPDIPAIVRANSLDSAEAQGIIDSNFQNLSQSIIPNANGSFDLGSDAFRFKDLYLSGNSIILGTLTLSDSAGEFSVIQANGEKAKLNIDSQVSSLINTSYIQSAIDKTFIDTLGVDADTLDGQQGSWYRDYNNLFNKPPILDGIDVENIAGAYIDLSFLRNTTDSMSGNLIVRGGITVDSNLTVGGYIAGPSLFYIDPAGIGNNTGKVVIRGDLQIDGEQTIVNSTTVSIQDKNIVLADSAADSAEANGAGITVNGANATIKYTSITDTWDFNKKVSAPNIDVSGAFVSETLVGKYLGFDSDLANTTTDGLPEGTTNLYYTTARSDSDFDVRLATKSTTNIAEGSNLYYTTVRADSDFDVRLATKSTDDLSEGLNQYYTTARHNADTLLQVDSAYVQVRQDYAYASLTGAPTNVSQFANDAGYITTAQSTDSAEVSGIILEDVDSAYVQARQDFAYASLTGAPTNVSQFANDANYLDSNTVTGVIDATYVQSNQTPQDFAYASLTGAPTNVSAFTNDANYLDSNTSQAVINTNFAAKTTDDLTEGSTNQYYLKSRVDSDIAASLSDSVNTVTVTINNTIEEKVDSAYVLARINEAPFLDSADAINLIDSAYVQLRQDFAYSSLTGKPNQGLNTTDSVTFSGLTVSGNLTVSGTQSVINTEVFKVIDPLIHLGDSNINSDIVDIGFIGKYYGDGKERHTGLVRVANDGEYYLYTNSIDSASDSVNNINLTAPGFTLATLNVGNITGQYQGFDSDFGTKSTSDLTEGSNLYYTDARVTAHVDAAYVQALQTPQDFAFSSLTGTPTTIAGYGITDAFDGAYSSLTGTPTTVSTFTNDANYLDSNTVTGVIDATYIQSNQTAQDFSYASLTGAPNVLDSADVIAIHNALGGVDSAAIINLIDSAYIAARTSAGTDSATVVSIINSTVDSAYISALGFGTGEGTVDSADIIAIVDSAYVQARQLNEVAAPLTQSTTNFVATLGQTSFNGLSIDSDKFQVYINGLLLPRADYTHNSTQVDLIVAADSGDVVEVLKFTGNDTGAIAIQQRHYVYTATSSQTIFTGSDDNSATLSYTQGRINVYLNGLLLLDTVDYTQNAAGDTVTFTSGVTAGHIVNIQTLTGNTGTFAPLSQTLYEYTADSGQTVFTGVDDNAATLDFSNDKVVVYLNGILLTSTDYTLSGGNTVTLDTAADSGNHLTVAKLSGNNIGLDSAQVNALIALSPGTDSAAIINLIDSAYVQARTTAGTDSATVVSIVNEYIDQTATSLTTTVVDQVVDTFAAVTYRTAKYIVQFSHPSDSKYHSTEVLLMHDGTTVYMTEYAEVKTDSSLGTIDADINAGNVRLLVTPSYTNTGVNVTRTNVTV